MENDRPITELKAFLEGIPDNARVWAYEGESTGLVIDVPPDLQVAFFDTRRAEGDRPYEARA